MSEAMDEVPGDQVRAGRMPAPTTNAPDWVALSGVSAVAHSIYVKLLMHVNHRRGDGRVWPGMDALAMMTGYSRNGKIVNYSRGDKISPYVQELVAIGAIDIERQRMPRRNIYTVHAVPPPGYDKPLSLADWYKRNRPALEETRAADKEVRDARRGAKPQVNPVPPAGGEQADDAPVPPAGGGSVPPAGGEQSPPAEGVNLFLKNPPEINPPPPTPPRTPRARAPQTSKEAEVVEENLSDETQAVLREHRPTWTRTAIAAALAHPEVREREQALPGVAEEALRLLAADTTGNRYEVTRSPARLAAAGPWWETAARQLRPAPADPGPADRPSCPSGCRGGRILADSSDRVVVLHCPTCRPDRHKAQLERFRAAAQSLEVDPPRDFDELVAHIRACPQGAIPLT